MAVSIGRSWGAQAELTGLTAPLFGILLPHEQYGNHSRRRTGGQRGGPEPRLARNLRAPCRNATRASDRRAPYGRRGRARLLQLAQEHQARQRGGAFEGGAHDSGVAADRGGETPCGGRGRRVGGGSGAVLPRRDAPGGGASPHCGGAPRGDGHPLPCRRLGRDRLGERPAHLRRALIVAYGPDGARRPGLLRRCGAGGDGGFHRLWEGVPPKPLRGRRCRRRLSERPVHPGGVRRLHRAASRGRARHRQGLRDPRAVPSLPAHRGDSPGGPRRPALRHPEAGGAHRSAHGAPPLGGFAAARRGRPRRQLQPRRVPDQPHLPRAAPRVSHDPRPGRGGVRALRRHAPQHLHRRAAAARPS